MPSQTLMTVQKWIERFVLSNLEVHSASHAFRRGSSIVRCAQQHCGARWLVKMDIADFFGSITEIQIYRVFRKLGYVPLVAFELARLCTDVPTSSNKHRLIAWKTLRKRKGIKAYSNPYLGRLPQGAPSSPMLANLAMMEMDVKISQLASKYGLTYTRYSDDLTFSTKNEFSRAKSTEVIREVALLLKSKGLYPNNKKTAVIPPGARKVVLGLLVDGDVPRLSREFRDRMRQHLYYLETLGIQTHVDARGFDSVGGFYRHFGGLIDYANMVNPQYAAAIKARFTSLPWTGM